MKFLMLIAALCFSGYICASQTESKTSVKASNEELELAANLSDALKDMSTEEIAKRLTPFCVGGQRVSIVRAYYPTCIQLKEYVEKGQVMDFMTLFYEKRDMHTVLKAIAKK